MSATATSMYDFIETFAVRVPYNDIHPLSLQLVHNDICDMREMAHHGDDPSYISSSCTASHRSRPPLGRR